MRNLFRPGSVSKDAGSKSASSVKSPMSQEELVELHEVPKFRRAPNTPKPVLAPKPVFGKKELCYFCEKPDKKFCSKHKGKKHERCKLCDEPDEEYCNETGEPHTIYHLEDTNLTPSAIPHQPQIPSDGLTDMSTSLSAMALGGAEDMTPALQEPTKKKYRRRKKTSAEGGAKANE